MLDNNDDTTSNVIKDFTLRIHDASNIEMDNQSRIHSFLAAAHCSVHAAITDGEGNARVVGSLATSKNGWAGTPSFKVIEDGETKKNKVTYDKSNGSELCLGDVELDEKIEIVLRRTLQPIVDEIGRTVTSVRELMDMEEKAPFLVFDKNQDVVPEKKLSLPALVRVSVVKKEKTFAREKPAPKYAKHLMVVTRGTRGDVQPFLALARGLAELHNWEITFVTEMSFKETVKKQAGVKRGALHWRPSGGDTMTRVNDPLAQKAINIKINAKQTNAMQKIFLARSEYEFFTSEPAVYYWANELKPDYLMFGFTMVSVAMIASEALGIPLLGFVLQPTSIPSREYPPVIPLLEENYKKLTAESIEMAHDQHNLIKYCMDNTPLIKRFRDLRQDGHVGLSSLRERRGLSKFDGYEVNAWQELLDGNYPLIIPINQTMYGGKPSDWSSNTVFTDNIFLRGDSVPPIAPDAQAFLDKAKAMDGKVVVLAFSSMPVSKTQIISIALKLVRECKEKVCVFALVGKQLALPLDNDIKAGAETAQDEGRLFMAAGAPFGRLFSLVDAVVLHGGLGTTSEAIQAEIPAIVTGVLLLDQRFWGARCSSMKVGPFGVHIDDFPEKCVKTVDKAVKADSKWRKNAKRIGRAMKEEAKDDVSGVQRNAECVVRLSLEAKPYKYVTDEELIASGKKPRGSESVVGGFKSVVEDFYKTSFGNSSHARSSMSMQKRIKNSSDSDDSDSDEEDDGGMPVYLSFRA